ncbi:MAG: hypothetical protein FWG35_00625 [Spirochaetaceae bacterium]|nr:hypothetical protein [Spirochaetaceae bacterium]
MGKKIFCLAAAAFFFLAQLAAEETAAETIPEDAAAEAAQPPAEDSPPEENAHDLYYIIAHIMEDDVIFSTDPRDSVSAGDLYVLLSGEEDAGLLLVSEAEETYAVARVLSADKELHPGDRVRLAACAGLEAAVFGGKLFTPNFDNSSIYLAGLKLTLARGVFYTRPVLEIGFPFARVHPDLAASAVVPFTVMGGAEITNIYLGRFQIAPVMLLGMGWAYMKKNAREVFGTSETFRKTHIAGKGSLSFSFLLSRHIKLTAEAGMLVLLDIGTALSNVSPEYFGRISAPFVNFGLALR